MGHLTMVSAGAGSGKTTDLCDAIAAKIAEGLDPARIMATTFTRKAAGELKGRIQERILKAVNVSADERLRTFERLELAALGTVHSVGHALIGRYALELGLSPRLQILEDQGQALNDLLSEGVTHDWEELVRLGNLFEMSSLQGLVRKTLDTMRANRIGSKPFQAQLAAGADRLCRLMCPDDLLNEKITFEGLYRCAGQTLRTIGALQDETKITTNALEKLRRATSRALHRYGAFARLQGMKAGKRSGADEALEPLRQLADNVLASRMLHTDVKRFVELLARQTLFLETRYREYKRERGLVDFTDLETLFLELLEDDRLTARLASDFEYVVVDEFQDTNPLQLAIFRKLKQIARDCRWVGDRKQSIFGFRGTATALVDAVWETVPHEDRMRLPINYRSQAGLVRLAGRLFEPAFGEDARQEADRPVQARGIERWKFASGNQQEDAECLAGGIVRMLNQECIPAQDVAVLCATNHEAEAIGEACKAYGISALLPLPGLFRTREGALLLAGLRFVADGHDSLAEAIVEHILSDPYAETPDWLGSFLKRARQEGEPTPKGDPALETTSSDPAPGDLIRSLREIDPAGQSPAGTLSLIMEKLQIEKWLPLWSETPRRAANVDTVLDWAVAYRESVALLGGAATLPGFVAYLEDLIQTNSDFTRPPYGMDAVTILTYHASKGLEWPVVILAGLNHDREAELWAPVASGGAGKGDDPLKDRTMRYWPWPFGHDDHYGTRKKGTALEGGVLDSTEGREALALRHSERQRLLYVGFTRGRDKIVLAHRERKYAWLQEAVPHIDDILNPALEDGEHHLADFGTSYVLRTVTPGEDSALRRQTPTRQVWLAPPESTAEITSPSPRYLNPGTVEFTGAARVVLQPMGGPSRFLPRAYGDSAQALGDALHAWFAALPSLAACQEHRRLEIARRCQHAFGVQDLLTCEDLMDMAKRLEGWIVCTYPQAQWQTEVPVSAPGPNGSQWNGTIDLLLSLADDRVVVVDHKTSPIQAQQCETKAATHLAQLDAYREILAAQGLGVETTLIHFPMASVMANVERGR